MARQPVSSQSTGSQSSILDDIGGFFSKLWHGITSFFSSLFGGDKSKSSATSPTASDDDQQTETPASNRQTNARGMRRSRRPDFTRAANNNSGMFPANNGMSFASATNGGYFSQVPGVSSRFNGNSFGGRESFAPVFAGHNERMGGGMSFGHGGGMRCGGGGRHR